MVKDERTRNAYRNEYRKKNYVQFSFYLRPEGNEDVIEKLKSVDSMPKYLIELVRKDIKTHL